MAPHLLHRLEQTSSDSAFPSEDCTPSLTFSTINEQSAQNMKDHLGGFDEERDCISSRGSIFKEASVCFFKATRLMCFHFQHLFMHPPERFYCISKLVKKVCSVALLWKAIIFLFEIRDCKS